MSALRQSSPIVYRKLQEVENEKKLKQSFLWGSLNGFLLFIILCDLNFNGRLYGSIIHSFEMCLGTLFSVNLFFHIGRVLWTKTKLKFIISSPNLNKRKEEKSTVPELEEEFSCYQRANWEVITGEEISDSHKYFSARYFSNPTTPITLRNKGDILTQKDLKRYLREYEEAERASFVASSVESQSVFINQFWNASRPLTPMEVSPILRRTVYQISPTIGSNDTSGGHSSSEECGSPVVHMNTEFWKKHKGTQYDFINWISNLRMWISITIMQRLVSEIEIVNNGLRNHGLVGISVGNVGLDTLINTANNIIIAHTIPTLPFIIPFLQVSPNQQYVVQRIKDLAIGTSMSEYNWKTGGKSNDKEWEPPLPTDAEFVMHMVRSYLDSQLPLLACEPDARPFTSQYFAKSPNKPRKTDIAIYQQNTNPPHFQLYVNNEVQDIPPGRNNLFYAILLFLLHVDKEYHGMLGRLNLGRSGLNMMWIVDNSNQ